MYCTQKKLQKMFDIGSTFTTHICRLIDAYEDRYDNLGKIGGRYSAIAFADAYAFRANMENNEPLPPFRPDIIAQFLVEPSDDSLKDFYSAGVRKTRQTLFDEVQDYFSTTQMPDRQLANCIRNAVLTIITTSEVKP